MQTSRYGGRLSTTLDEFLADHPQCTKEVLSTGAIQLFPRNCGNYDLYVMAHLLDYVITSAVSGPSFILVRR